LEGKSSTGRLGIDIHATAGKGDVGLRTLTLEISVKQPVKIYRNADRTTYLFFWWKAKQK
jgi:dCTP deaminase